MDWFLYDNGLHHERVKIQVIVYTMRQIQVRVFKKPTW